MATSSPLKPWRRTQRRLHTPLRGTRSAGELDAVVARPENYNAWIEIVPQCRPAISAKRMGQGDRRTVILRFQVSAEGTLVDAQVIGSSGLRYIDYMTIDALKRCKFHPAMDLGTPVESSFRFAFKWEAKRDPLIPD